MYQSKAYSQSGGWTLQMIECYQLDGDCKACSIGKMSGLSFNGQGCQGYSSMKKVLGKYGEPPRDREWVLKERLR